MLCRLFKKADLKQDEIAESSNINEVEEIIPSPIEVKSLAEDEQSESVTPTLGGLGEMQPSSVESNPTLNSEKPIGTPLSIDCPSNSCIADEMELDTISIPVSDRTVNFTFFAMFSVLVYFNNCIVVSILYSFILQPFLFSLIQSWKNYWVVFVPPCNRHQIGKFSPPCTHRCNQSLDISTCVVALLVTSTIINRVSLFNMEQMLMISMIS